jgi:hypothetical protein
MKISMKLSTKIVRAIATATTAVGLVTVAATPVDAAATTFTERSAVSYTEPFLGPCDGSVGTLTVEGGSVAHVTDSGSSYRFHATTRASFVYDPDDPTLPTATGHFVAQDMVTLNYAQLKDARQRLLTRAIAVSSDGDRFPILFTTVTLYGADGSVEVLIDEVRCPG